MTTIASSPLPPHHQSRQRSGRQTLQQFHKTTPQKKPDPRFGRCPVRLPESKLGPFLPHRDDNDPETGKQLTNEQKAFHDTVECFLRYLVLLYCVAFPPPEGMTVQSYSETVQNLLDVDAKMLYYGLLHKFTARHQFPTDETSPLMYYVEWIAIAREVDLENKARENAKLNRPWNPDNISDRTQVFLKMILDEVTVMKMPVTGDFIEALAVFQCQDRLRDTTTFRTAHKETVSALKKQLEYVNANTEMCAESKEMEAHLARAAEPHTTD